MKKGTIIIIVLLVVLAVGLGIFIFLKKREEAAAIGESFLNDNSQPRGISNNNPGNIIRTASLWDGEIPHSESTDTKFKQFETFDIGTMQMIDLLIRYWAKGRNTIRKAINFWDFGNTGYMEFLSDYTGFGIDEVLTPNEYTLKKLSQGITRFENGIDFLTDARFKAGYKLLNRA